MGRPRPDGVERYDGLRQPPPLAWPLVSRSRLRRPPGAFALGLAVLVGAVGSAGVLVAARDQSEDVETIPELELVLEEASNDAPAENFLLVGSDSRQNVDPNDPNAAVIGDANDVVGSRSDTIMILRREKGGGASLLSLPRDLWVPIAGRGESNRINSAFNDGPDVLAQTITEALGIPIQHYVEVDFVGFQRLVDAIGGVEVCTMHLAQDLNSGLRLNPGCQNLNGSMALAYARSRHYEEWVDGDWEADPTGDIGRIAAPAELHPHSPSARCWPRCRPTRSRSTGCSRRPPAPCASTRAWIRWRRPAPLKAAAEEGLQTYSLPVVGVEIDDKSVLELGEGAQPILDYFRGVGPPPTTVATTVPG